MKNKTPVKMEGEKFNRLFVVSEHPHRNKDRRIMYDCLCDCGDWVVISGKSLRSGHTKSCGCYAEEVRKRNNSLFKSVLVEGYSTKSHPLYRVYQGMLTRCYNESHEHYRHYGGRGIEVCERWRESFRDFVEDIPPRPKGLTLDRIDNEKGYFPGNIKWSTMKEQCQNRRPNSGWRKKRGG